MSTATRPPTPALDPVLVEVVGSAFSTIVEEMSETLVKAAFSPNIKERRDCTASLFDAQGRAVAQDEGGFGHAAPARMGSARSSGGFDEGSRRARSMPTGSSSRGRAAMAVEAGFGHF